MAQCSTCGASLKPGAMRCLKCGTTVEIPAPPPAQGSQSNQAEQVAQNNSQQQYASQPQVMYVQQPQQQAPTIQCTKSKSTACILAILLGWIGVHKFYLGKVWQGLLYLIFCWTWIPMVVGIIEGIVYLGMSEYEFCQKYGKTLGGGS